MNDITMSTHNPFNDVNSSLEDVESVYKQKDTFTFTVKVDKEMLKGCTCADLLTVLFERLKHRIVFAPNEKTHYEPGFYKINLQLPIEEVIVDGDTMCLVTQGNPFTESNGVTKHILPFYADICIEEECDYGPEDEEE